MGNSIILVAKSKEGNTEGKANLENQDENYQFVHFRFNFGKLEPSFFGIHHKFGLVTCIDYKTYYPLGVFKQASFEE